MDASSFGYIITESVQERIPRLLFFVFSSSLLQRPPPFQNSRALNVVSHALMYCGKTTARCANMGDTADMTDVADEFVLGLVELERAATDIFGVVVTYDGAWSVLHFYKTSRGRDVICVDRTTVAHLTVAERIQLHAYGAEETADGGVDIEGDASAARRAEILSVVVHGLLRTLDVARFTVNAGDPDMQYAVTEAGEILTPAVQAWRDSMRCAWTNACVKTSLGRTRRGGRGGAGGGAAGGGDADVRGAPRARRGR
jgi:hypothetical protein